MSLEFKRKPGTLLKMSKRFSFVFGFRYAGKFDNKLEERIFDFSSEDLNELAMVISHHKDHPKLFVLVRGTPCWVWEEEWILAK